MTGSGVALFPEFWTRQGEVIADCELPIKPAATNETPL